MLGWARSATDTAVNNKTDKHLCPSRSLHFNGKRGNHNKQSKKVKYMKWKLVKNLWEKSKAGRDIVVWGGNKMKY